MQGVKMKKCCGLIMVLVALCLFPYSAMLRAAEIPSVEDVMKGKAKLPTIEDLTDGKVKIGDLINKNNVDLVKEYVSHAVYETVKQGMVLRMGTQLPPDRIVPEYFREITKRNMGKAIIDENGTVYYEKMGTLWPGGLPFPEPKTGLEVASNVKFGCVWDDLRNYHTTMKFIGSKGSNYKTVHSDMRYVLCTSRKRLPPFGTIPGYEDVMYKRITVIASPLEVKGLGQYSVRYYDDVKREDTGFAYLPAFKRTIRVSSSIWQDNVAGSDCTYGDGQGIQEPYSYWTFKLIGTKYILSTEPSSPFPILDEKGETNKRLQFDVGKKFPRLGWSIWPVHVIEAIPRVKHIYGKKVVYTFAWPYWSSISQFALVDIYDRQMKLWKLYTGLKGDHQYVNGDYYAADVGVLVHDLQTGHTTQYWMISQININKYKPTDLTLKTLLEVGR